MLAVLVAPAQTKEEAECPGKIYGAGEVTKRARIVTRPDLSSIHSVIEPTFRGVIVLGAVLCRTGQLTDIRVIKGASPEVNQFAMAQLNLVRFIPAELRWHSVSQRTQFEFSIGDNEPGIKLTTSAETAGRLVEEVDIVGQRRLTTEQVLSFIRTRPGEPFDLAQLERDLEAILATGQFDKSQTGVTTEDGVRGGVVVIFEVFELPLINEVSFEGLTIDRSTVFEAWEREHINMRTGRIYNVDATKAAIRVLEQVLNSKGQSNAHVEERIEHLTAMNVNIIFVITPK